HHKPANRMLNPLSTISVSARSCGSSFLSWSKTSMGLRVVGRRPTEGPILSLAPCLQPGAIIRAPRDKPYPTVLLNDANCVARSCSSAPPYLSVGAETGLHLGGVHQCLL